MTAPMTSRVFVAAYALDLAAGDPPRFPHPVRAMGWATTVSERWLRRPGPPAQEFLRGALVTGLIAGGSWAVAERSVRFGGFLSEVLLAWTTLATKSLLDESRAVIDAVERGELVRARQLLARIVGRDTGTLEEPEILRAVIE